MARNGQKIKLLCLLDILRLHTDEEHPMPANEICDRLAQMGITAERKAIYNDIAALTDYGYDIIKTRVPRPGFFLASREFELPEIYLLADAVRSAKFISPKKTRELLGKLDGMLSLEQARRREKSIFFDTEGKCTNEELFYIIDGISTAIETQKQITFRYTTRSLSEDRSITNVTREMTISPYAMTWQSDHYYVIGNYEKYNNLLHLRIDRMRSVKITEKPSRPYSEVCEYKEFFDVADYTKKLFSMYGGKEGTVELRCERSILEQVIDRFSDNIFIRNVTDTHFTFSTEAIMSDGLIGWILGYGEKIEVISPAALREDLTCRLEAISNLYACDK